MSAYTTFIPKDPEWHEYMVPSWKTATLTVLILVTVVICLFTRPADTTPRAGVVMELPRNDMRSGWLGHDTAISEAEIRILPDDTEFARRTYTNLQRDAILLSIVLAGSQDRSIHRPERCLPGQGFTLNNTTPISVEMPNGQVLHAQCLDLSRPVELRNGEHFNARSLYIYWYVGDNFSTHQNWERITRSMIDRIFFNRQHRWAYIICSSQITASIPGHPQPKTRDETLAMLKNFMRTMVPQFQKNFMESGAEELDAEVIVD